MSEALSAPGRTGNAGDGRVIYGFAAGPKLAVPTLVLYGAHEEVVSVDAAREFIESLPKPPAPVRVAVYPRGYHLLLRDRGAETVIGDVAAWIERPGEPLPSGADGSGVAAFVAR